MKKGYFKKDIAQLENPNSWQSKFGIKVTKLGVMPVPSILYRFRKLLNLTYSDILFIGYILMHKQNGQWPYISLAKMTREYKISQDTLNKSVKRLRKQNFLITKARRENIMGKGRNYYDLSGLINCLEVLVDKYDDDLFKKKHWKMDDHLDYMVLKDYEKETPYEKQRAEDVENEEYNK